MTWFPHVYPNTHYFPNRWAWRLAKPAPIKPGEKAVGHLGLWDWTPSPIVREWLLAHYPEQAA